jgi:hypothetical protein
VGVDERLLTDEPVGGSRMSENFSFGLGFRFLRKGMNKLEARKQVVIIFTSLSSFNSGLRHEFRTAIKAF